MASYFVYSRHRTEFEAVDALQGYFADFVVSVGDRPLIQRRGGSWCVLLLG